MVDAAFTGHLTDAPKVSRFEKTGKVKVTARVAVNNSYVNSKGERIELEPVFFSIEAWGEGPATTAAEAIEAINRTGRNPLVMVQGQWRSSSWTDEASGEPRRMQYVSADAFAVVPTAKAKSQPKDEAGQGADERWSDAAEAAANE